MLNIISYLGSPLLFNHMKWSYDDFILIINDNYFCSGNYRGVKPYSK